MEEVLVREWMGESCVRGRMVGPAASAVCALGGPSPLRGQGHGTTLMGRHGAQDRRGASTDTTGVRNRTDPAGPCLYGGAMAKGSHPRSVRRPTGTPTPGVPIAPPRAARAEHRAHTD